MESLLTLCLGLLCLGFLPGAVRPCMYSADWQSMDFRNRSEEASIVVLARVAELQPQLGEAVERPMAYSAKLDVQCVYKTPEGLGPDLGQSAADQIVVSPVNVAMSCAFTSLTAGSSYLLFLKVDQASGDLSPEEINMESAAASPDEDSLSYLAEAYGGGTDGASPGCPAGQDEATDGADVNQDVGGDQQGPEELREGQPEPDDQEPDQTEPGPNEPETDGPEPDEPEPNGPEPNEPEADETEQRDPEPKDSEADEPEPTDTEADETEQRDPEPKDGEADEPEPNATEADEPEPNATEADEPEPNDTEADEPEPTDAEPEPNNAEPEPNDTEPEPNDTEPQTDEEESESPEGGVGSFRAGYTLVYVLAGIGAAYLSSAAF